MNSTRLMIVFCASLAAGALWPADAAAQHGGYAVPRGRSSVVVSAGYYRPYYGSYYRPYYYNPFAFGFGYGFGYGYGYPYYAGFYPYYGGPYGGYPYPYYGYSGNWASARIEVKPREAQVFLDGYLVGNVDQFDGVFQRLDLPTGEHEITVYVKGYRSYRQRTVFRPGESYHFKAILEPLAAGAPEEPAPQPAPNQVDPYTRARDPHAYDHYPQDPGQDPNRPPPPEPGDPSRTRPMPDRPDDRRAPDSAGFGTLNVRVQPGDATIVIDGERWDSPEAGSRLSVQLLAGPHRVEVRKDGFKPYSSSIQIRPGESQALNISLPPGQ